MNCYAQTEKYSIGDQQNWSYVTCLAFTHVIANSFCDVLNFFFQFDIMCGHVIVSTQLCLPIVISHHYCLISVLQYLSQILLIQSICVLINLIPNNCRYCPGGPDSDFEYSTQSYTGYEVS